MFINFLIDQTKNNFGKFEKNLIDLFENVGGSNKNNKKKYIIGSKLPLNI